MQPTKKKDTKKNQNYKNDEKKILFIYKILKITSNPYSPLSGVVNIISSINYRKIYNYAQS